ncbi:hypothetical protein ONZ51_g9966 [Trametes cubensis]|uniref:Uncharacterized protein n=1 Tax=Trametes cubensis TaxID=1111947 RepID=A0AAD7X9B5_9APHY|nr:hypothetical protein ONZ51_g9966 [Trametes cubensis]
MSDRGYINLIRHLTRASSTLPLETLQASIAHYLARPPIPIPGSPTSLTATALGSPLFRIHTHARLSALALAFRHAVHLRVGVLKEEAEANPGGLLSRGVNVRAKLARWSKDVREGFKGSDAVIHLACASGLLLGLEDWETELQLKEKERRERAKVEEEVVIALAEVIDEYAREGSGWEKDFKRTVGAKGDEDPLPLAMLLASQCGHCIASERLQALPLPTIIDVLMTTIDRSFYSGAFLSGASLSGTTDTFGKIVIEPTSSFAQTIRTVSGSTYMASMSFIARFTARAITVLVESRRAPGWEAIGRVLARLQSVTSKVEQDWSKCPLAEATEEDDLAGAETREIATSTWSILKTLLFMTLMLSQSILAAVVFVPNSHSDATSPVSPHSIALNIMQVLAQLSFVMPQFGGVASTAEGGLPELKRVDVVPRSLHDARAAFMLACVEQLIPKLSEETIQTRVYPLCVPHIWDPRCRETYESAHSVMLAIFATYALGAGRQENEPHRARAHPAFAEMLVPMYAQCLVENSADGRLSTTQLCMAYAALVRGASACGHDSPSNGESTPAGDAMAWLCIKELLNAISRHSPSKETSAPPSERLHRLHLALVAAVPAVSLSLLPRLLNEVKAIITSLPTSEGRTGEMRGELVQALFKVILQDIGDAEKEFVIDWWDENRETLVGRSEAVIDVAESTGSLVARL